MVNSHTHTHARGHAHCVGLATWLTTLPSCFYHPEGYSSTNILLWCKLKWQFQLKTVKITHLQWIIHLERIEPTQIKWRPLWEKPLQSAGPTYTQKMQRHRDCFTKDSDNPCLGYPKYWLFNIQIWQAGSQRNFAHTTTALLLWHVQNFVVIEWLEYKLPGIGFQSNYDLGCTIS